MNNFSGKHWFKCEECNTRQLVARREMNRAARVRCIGCGSARLVISKAGSEKLAVHHDAAQEAVVGVDQTGRGSIIT
jgi:ribosomal protein S27E